MRFPLSDEKRSKALDYYRQNVALKGIAKYLKISYSSVERIVRQGVWDGLIEPRKATFGKPRPAKGEGMGRRYNYQRRGYKTGCQCLPLEKQEELISDYKDGMKYADLMAKYGIWQHQIKAIIDRAGIPPRLVQKQKRKEVKANDI